jgi:hypothetical protein
MDWSEIISENFMIDGGLPLEVLDQILEQCRSGERKGNEWTATDKEGGLLSLLIRMIG